MRKFLAFSMAVCALTLSSCLSIVEELFLNEDGSGTYILSYDLGEMIADPAMQEMVLGMLAEDSSAVGYLNDRDTVMRLSQADLNATSNPDFWKNLEVHFQVNQNKGICKIDMKLAFHELKDIDYFNKNFAELSATENGDIFGMGELRPGGALYELRKGSLSRLPSAYFESIKSEDMAVMELFFGSSSTYTSIYHLPGKVSKAKMEGATIEGNTVTVKYPIDQVLQGNAKLDGSISYK